MKATIMILYFVFFTLLSVYSQVNYDYSNNFSAVCNQIEKSNLSKTHVFFKNDSIIIEDVINNQCCPKFALKISEIINDSLFVTFSDTTTMTCKCICNFDVKINAGKFINNSLTIIYNGESYILNSYDSIVVESKIWSSVSGYYGADMNEHVLETTFIKFAVDPTINTIDEMQVLKSNDSLKTWTKIGNIKEIDKKIYFRNLENKLGLLYDFSLKQGDSIITVNTSVQYIDSIIFKVVKIDTINYFGVDRKRFEVIDILSHMTDYWIEGIGSIESLFRPTFSSVGGFMKLLCVHENSIQIYQNPMRNTCYEPAEGTGIEEISKSKFYVFPNPTFGKIFIEGLNETQNLNMCVYNILGTLIYRQNIMTKDIQLNLQKGIYILAFEGKGNFHYKQIITIN